MCPDVWIVYRVDELGGFSLDPPPAMQFKLRIASDMV